MENRFHNPYRHAVLGLLFEVAIFAVFVAALCALALVFARIG